METQKASAASKKKSLRPLRTLVLVDSRPLRRKAIQGIQKWTKKIDELQKKVLRFHETDLKLYTDWYNLTIEPYNQKISKSEEAFQQLAERYNSLVFLSQIEDVSLPEALLIFQEEEEAYQKGSLEQKQKIEGIRAQRKQEIEKEIREKMESDLCQCRECRVARGEISKEESEEDAQQELKSEYEKVQKVREDNKRRVEFYENLTEKKLSEVMGEFDDGYDFVLKAITVLIKAARTDVLKKIWVATPKKIQRSINRRCQVELGITIDEMISLEDAREQAFARHFGKGPEGHAKVGPTETLVEDDVLRVKFLFRKIARMIHPDHMQSADFVSLKPWFDDIWRQVSEAHRANDRPKLETLYCKILVMLKHFDELSLTELENTTEILKTDYNLMSREGSEFKGNPAWNFSKLKDYSKLEKKQVKPFLERLESLENEIEEVQFQLRNIEHYAELIKTGQRAPPKKVKKRRR